MRKQKEQSKYLIIRKLMIAMCILMVLVSLGNGVSYVQARRLSYTTTVGQRNAIANDWTYVERGYADYNCLAYALGNTTSWDWPFGSVATKKEAKSYLESKGYTVKAASAKDNGKSPKIFVYALNGEVTHFAKFMSWAFVRPYQAKWGACEVFSSYTNNPYTDNLYGQLVYKAYK